MGWNFALMHLGPSAQGLLHLGEDTTYEPDHDENTAWAYVDDSGTTVVTGGVFRPQAVAELSSRTSARIVVTYFGSTGGGYGFEVHERGTVVRDIGVVQGTPTEEVGIRLPEEDLPSVTNAEFDEDRFAALFVEAARTDSLRAIGSAAFARVASPDLLLYLD
ncbi:hypothetical protein FK529_10430 [Tsukamurella asaccharolytica]|uniref:Uncharacterized protein n=1 Tax=Tsukamurella asaccharolytica TaxID=2592067 RepID=A0A5C5RA92_9ACTN|nr:hypothetical protein [Tsukamurella asaccharolytica]TWS19592.1 hypothetical protein FK529_10430 [Tsukamurella asaccharolytica]